MSLIVEARYEKRGDPRGLPERDLPRAAGLDPGPRRRRGVEPLLRQGRAASSRPRRRRCSPATINNPNGRSPFRHPGARAGAPQPRARDDARAGPPRRRRRPRRRRPSPSGSRRSPPSPARRASSSTTCAASFPSSTTRTSLTSRGHAHLLDPRPAPPARRGARGARGARAAREGLPAARARGRARLEACLVALRPQTGEMRRPRRRPRVRREPVRPLHARRGARWGAPSSPSSTSPRSSPIVGGPTITLASWLDDSPLVGADALGALAAGELRQGVPRARAAARRRSRARSTWRRRASARRSARSASPRSRGASASRARCPLVPSLALGAADVAPLELALAYATLANGGVRPGLRAFEDVVDASGVRVERQPLRAERVLDPGTAFLVDSAPRGGGGPRHGPRGARARASRGPVAGKTGTTNDEYDTWFAGYTPELAVVVWVGFDQPRSIGLPAARVALPIWVRFVKDASGGSRARDASSRPSRSSSSTSILRPAHARLRAARAARRPGSCGAPSPRTLARASASPGHDFLGGDDEQAAPREEDRLPGESGAAGCGVSSAGSAATTELAFAAR